MAAARSGILHVIAHVLTDPKQSGGASTPLPGAGGGGAGGDRGVSYAQNNNSRSDVVWAAPPSLISTGLRGGGGGGAGGDLDSNILIVTLSLLTVLILSLGLHFLIRWAITRFCQVSPHVASAASSMALRTVRASSLPTRLYRSDPLCASHGATSASVCSICLAEFADGDRVRLLPLCQHGFHVACIDRWLSQHASCPICRGTLLGFVPAEDLPFHVRLHILIAKDSASPPSS